MTVSVAVKGSFLFIKTEGSPSVLSFAEVVSQDKSCDMQGYKYEKGRKKTGGRVCQNVGSGS